VVVNPPPTPQPTITTTQVAPPPAPVAIAPPPRPEAPPAPPPPPPAPARVAAKPAIADVRACAPTADDYPPAAQRADATGTTRIRFTVDASGKMTAAEVVKSAGPSREHRLLDRVAQTKLSECTFTPGIDETGKRAGGVFEVEYVWKLQ
jgi:protein TonB